jgi:hypothetical protein
MRAVDKLSAGRYPGHRVRDDSMACIRSPFHLHAQDQIVGRTVLALMLILNTGTELCKGTNVFFRPILHRLALS